MDDETLEFVLEAVKIVAEEGWKLLPQVNSETSRLSTLNIDFRVECEYNYSRGVYTCT